MDYKKIIIGVLLVILIVSDIFMLFGDELLGEYTLIFAMLAIASGVSLIIMVIINGRKRQIKINKERSELGYSFGNKVESKICNICKTSNKLNAEFCVKCGTDLKDVTCPICKTVNPYNHKFCSNCDTILQNKKRH